MRAVGEAKGIVSDGNLDDGRGQFEEALETLTLEGWKANIAESIKSVGRSRK